MTSLDMDDVKARLDMMTDEQIRAKAKRYGLVTSGSIPSLKEAIASALYNRRIADAFDREQKKLAFW